MPRFLRGADTRRAFYGMKQKPFKFSLEYLKEALAYNPETGLFTWKRRPIHHFSSECRQVAFNTARASKTAGTETRNYVTLSLVGENWKAHRVAFFFVTGKEPICEVDHINRNKKDNRFCNLREAARTINRFNCNPSIRNRSGTVGVHWDKGCCKWAAKIKRSGKAKHLGVFDKLEDAIEARAKAETIYYADAI